MGAPLYILSFRHRDELARLAAGATWQVVATRRAEDAARRFTASGAAVAVLDTRGAVDEALAAASALGAAVRARGAALIVLVSRGELTRLGAFLEAGATQFLASPFAEEEFRAALQFAAAGGERRTGRARSPVALGWRFEPATRGVTLTPALALLAGSADRVTPAVLWRRLERGDRTAARAALKRAVTGGATAFAHDLNGVGRVVEHIQHGADGALSGVIEPLGDAPDAARALIDAFAVPAGDGLLGFLGRDLTRALAADEIELLFQPQIEIASGAITGVEALMRWRHPRLGELGAEALLEAADRAGLGTALSAHVQARALHEAAGWPAALSALRLSVNITADDLALPDFVATLLRRVADSGFAADRLTVEVTERGLIGDPEAAGALLAQVRAGGVRVAIDDFGTGYSSLAYLSQLPLDYLKLDRVLTQDIAGSNRDRIVVRGIVALAHSLGLAVIAEGVETEQQRDLLAREGCAYFQGFLCAGPVGVSELVGLIAG